MLVRDLNEIRSLVVEVGLSQRIDAHVSKKTRSAR